MQGKIIRIKRLAMLYSGKQLKSKCVDIKSTFSDAVMLNYYYITTVFGIITVTQRT